MYAAPYRQRERDKQAWNCMWWGKRERNQLQGAVNQVNQNLRLASDFKAEQRPSLTKLDRGPW